MLFGNMFPSFANQLQDKCLLLLSVVELVFCVLPTDRKRLTTLAMFWVGHKRLGTVSPSSHFILAKGKQPIHV